MPEAEPAVVANATEEVSGAIQVSPDGQLIILGEGTVINEKPDNAAIANYGILTIRGGTLESQLWNAGQLLVQGGILNGIVNSGSATIEEGSTINGNIENNAGTIAISGGQFENPVEEDWFADGYGHSSEANGDGYHDVHRHDYTAVVTQPTCSSEGYTTYTCTLCGHNYRDNQVAALTHSFADGKCSICGASEAMLGDTDGNGKVNLRDVLMLLQYVNGNRAAEEMNLPACHLDSNGRINLRDVLILLQFVNGKPLPA